MAIPAYNAVGTYAGIQGMVEELMNRNDMDSVLPALIAYAEGELARDVRIKNLKQASYSITGDGIAIPTAMKSLQSFVVDTTTYQIPLDVVDIDLLGDIKAKSEDSAVPTHVAIADSKFFFAPEPDATYAATIAYWEKLTPLAEGTNWLSTQHPDIYLAATMVEAAGWAKDSELADLWASRLERKVEQAFGDTWDKQYGGGRLSKQFETIG